MTLHDNKLCLKFYSVITSGIFFEAIKPQTKLRIVQKRRPLNLQSLKKQISDFFKYVV